MTSDIRWQQRFSNYRQALAHLGSAQPCRTAWLPARAGSTPATGRPFSSAGESCRVRAFS